MVEHRSRGRVVTHDVVGWQKIADALGVSRTTVWRWSRDTSDPVPVRSFRGRIVARKVELEDWASRNSGELTGKAG